MKLANQPPPQEIPLCQTSSLCPNSAAIGAVSLPAQAVAGRAALVLPGLQLLTSRGGESGPETRRETLDSPFSFHLCFPLGADPRPLIGLREERPEHWPWIFRFR